MKKLPQVERATFDDPLYSQRNPHQTFLLLLSIITSLPLLRGDAASATLEAVLDPVVLTGWGLCLLVGSIIAFVGEFWPGRTWTGLAIERAGLILVAVGAGIYSAIVWHEAGDVDDVRFAAGITFAYAASCLWRVGQITRRLRWINALIREINLKHRRVADYGEEGSR